MIATPNASRWSLDSPLADFMAAEYQPYIDEQASSHRCKVHNWLTAFGRMLGRPPTLGDMTVDTLDSLLSGKDANLVNFANIFRKVWKVAAQHVPLGIRPSRRDLLGVDHHGPAKWTKDEASRLLAAADRLGGTFTRKMFDGTLATIPRAVWLNAYVRVAKATALPMATIETVRCGDLTAAGILVVRGRRRGDEPRAMRLGKATLAAVKPLLAGPDDKLLSIAASKSLRRLYFRQLRQAARLTSTGYQLQLGNGSATLDRPKQNAVAVRMLPVSRFSLDSPLVDFIRDHYLPQKITVRAASTSRMYLVTVRKFAEALGRTPTIADLTEENVVRLLRYSEAAGLSPHTIQQRQHYIMAVVNFCIKRRIINWFVDVPKYPTPDLVPESWTVDEMRQLFAACDKMPGVYCGVPAAAWWRAFHAALWSTGERTSAVLAIEADWLNVETRVLAIPGRVRKGGRKSETYELTPMAVDALGPLLAACREAGRKEVFAFPATRHTFYNHYGRLLRAAGLPDGRRHKPQKIRRTFATFVELAGGDSTTALGHSCRRVTTEHYLDPKLIRKPPANRLLPAIEEPTEDAS